MPSILHRELYYSQKFYRNNLRILIISTFLFFEQLAYGIFVASPDSLLRTVYFISAFLMCVFSALSINFHIHFPHSVNFLHRGYELSLGIVGMGIVLIRVAAFQGEIFRVPTVYIAVLYGIAVVFIYNYYQSSILYALTTLMAVFLIPRFHPHIPIGGYRADVISNGCIAWLVSVMNYRNFVRDVNNTTLIRQKNEELQRKNEQIEKVNLELVELSIRDGLTNLFNRRKMDGELRENHAKAERYGTDFSVILLDLDFFKRINDGHGHEMGDIILKRIADILSVNIRGTDIAGRWGGEEFLVLCTETDLQNAKLLAERLNRKIAEEVFSGNIRMTASLGVASWTEYPDLRDLLNAADKRLYSAKSRGRDCVDWGE